MEYEEAREQFLTAVERQRSPVQRLRARLASNRRLRRTFDRTYGAAYKRLYSMTAVRNRRAPYLDRYPNVAFSPTGTGFSQNAEVARLARRGCVRGKDVLLIGVEYGSEVGDLWGPHAPASMVGIDLGDYEAGWSTFQGSARAPMRFLKMDAAALGFAECSFDLVYSQGVLPHVTNVPSLLADAERVLRPGGVFYAFCCPLWRTYGGSHVHAMGYDHLVLPEDEVLRQAKALEDGSFWWLQQGLFNKLRFRDLLAMIEERFDVLDVGVIEAPDGRRFRSEFPNEWRDLLRQHDEEDLLIRLTSFAARRKGCPTS